MKSKTIKYGTYHMILISAIVIAIVSGCVDNKPTETVSHNNNEYRHVENGFIIKNWYGYGGKGSIQIENGLDWDAVAVLSRENNKDDIVASVYVQLHDKYAMVTIPNGKYHLYFVAGKGWNNDIKKFSSVIGYTKFDEILEFESGEGYAVTLHPVPEGNAITEQISEDEFPNLR